MKKLSKVANFRLTTKAKNDLLHIGRTSEKQWGKAQRNRYLTELDRCFHFLADNPEAGTECDELRLGYRKHAHASHVIFYKLASKQSIDIIRILHKRMDPATRLPRL